MSALFEPATLGPLRLRNRTIKAATFEGRTPDGVVSDELIEFHRRMAAGGVAMSTVAYLAVAPEGRTDSGCLVLDDRTARDLRRLTDAVHSEGALVAAQLGHAGPVANAASNGVSAIAPGRMFNPLGLRRTRAASTADLERVIGDFRSAAARATDAGFDSLEVHLGHNYLPSAFLSPALNRRHDEWGSTLAGRARLARRIVEAVRSGAGAHVAVTAKVNMVDGVRTGLQLDDSLQVARWLQDDGHLDALELTGGSSLANPMYLFKGAAPLREFRQTLPWYLRGVFRLVGSRFLRTYPYSEAYFLPMARRFREELTLPLVLLGGISEMSTAESAIDGGFDFVAMGRALLHDPNLINGWFAGTAEASGCVHCNRCMPTIYEGTRCPLVDPRPGDRPVVVGA
ncbi:MAG: NADH:flavin oxidoreductase [Actinobacteria bacterium]|nr:NADH:flavin oxidoreductase [Actinomycetota bacterium]